MKKILILIICLILLSSCGTKNNKQTETIINKGEISMIKVTINGKEYNMNIDDNETTKELIKQLPLEVKMNELNGNEKYVYLDTSFPINEIKPKHINKGDVYLYGNNCIVIFYESFDTPYSYTLIGHIDNLPNLDKNDITVKFEQ